MEFAHVCLVVGDRERSAGFYVDELGFEPLDAPGDDRFVEADNGVSIQLREGPSDSSDPDGALDHLAFVVDDVDRVVETVDHHGLDRAPSDVEAAGVRTAFVRDPDGTRIELIEFLE